MFGVTAHNSRRVGEELPQDIATTGTPYSDRFGEGQLVPRTISKHGALLMNFSNACLWLNYMKDAVAEVLPHDARGSLSMARYFNHFLAFFEMTAEQRRELCLLCDSFGGSEPIKPRARL